MRSSPVCAIRAIPAMWMIACAARLAAQDAGTLERARQLRDVGDYGAAADSALVWLRAHPDDAGSHWMAAQLLYWNGRHDQARDEYDAALALAPSDPWLRVEYGEFLLALGEADAGAAIVGPVVESASAPSLARARGASLLGTRAYWSGDLPAAMRQLDAALALDPALTSARDLRDAIADAARPWAELEVALLDDDQPYRRHHEAIAGGVWLDPAWLVAIRGTTRTADRVDGRMLEAQLEVQGTLPGARVRVLGRGGGAWQTGLERAFVGAGEIGLLLGSGTVLRAGADRVRYLWTAASTDTLLMVTGLEAAFDRAGAPGWAGQAVVRRESFPDENDVVTAFAWVLAPVAPPLRIGYALSWQDASATRWSRALDQYDPYFTPERQRSHALLGELSARWERATLRVNGSWGFHATEDAPATRGPPPGGGGGVGPPQFASRSYTPWSVRWSLVGARLGPLDVGAEAERQNGAFYRLTRATMTATLRFGGAGAR